MCREGFDTIQNLPNPETDVSAWFRLVDVEGTGQLTKVEVRDVFAATLDVDQRSLDQLIEERWAEWDHDKAGHITESQISRMITFVSRALPGGTKGAPPDLQQDPGGWFDHFDHGLTGALSKDQMARAVIKSLGGNSGVDHEDCRNNIEAVWAVFCEQGVINRARFCANEGLGEAIAASLTSLHAGDEGLIERHLAHERYGEAPGRPCNGCGKIHVNIGDRVSRHPSTWTRGDEDGGQGTFGTVKLDDESAPGGVVVQWDSGSQGQYDWGPHGSSQVVHVAYASNSEGVQLIIDATGLPSNLALALLSRYGGEASLAVNQYFEGDATEEDLATDYPPLRLFWRARVLPEATRVKTNVEAHGELRWSQVRETNVGRECWILKIDEDDRTVQVLPLTVVLRALSLTFDSNLLALN